MQRGLCLCVFLFVYCISKDKNFLSLPFFRRRCAIEATFLCMNCINVPFGNKHEKLPLLVSVCVYVSVSFDSIFRLLRREKKTRKEKRFVFVLTQLTDTSIELFIVRVKSTYSSFSLSRNSMRRKAKGE